MKSGTNEGDHVDEHGVLQDRVYDEVPEGFKLNVVSQKGGHRFQVKLHPWSVHFGSPGSGRKH